MSRRRVGAVLASLIAVVVTPVVAAPPASAAGTAECGQLPAGTTTWTAVGSPYQICSDGVTVPAGSTLRIDALAGPVDVTFDSGGTLTVEGDMTTADTVPGRGVFMGASAAGSNAGVVYAHATPGSGADMAGSVTLSDTDLALSDVNLQASSVTLSRVQSAGADVVISSDAAAVTNSTFATPSCSSGSGLVINDAAQSQPSSADTVQFSGNHVQGCGVALATGQIAASNNEIDDVSAGAPLALGWGAFSLGPGGTVGGNTGANDATTAVELSGAEQGSFTWLPVPASSGSQQPLGYLGSRGGFIVDGPGAVLTVPADTTAYMPYLALDGATLDASAGGAHIGCQPLNPPVQCFDPTLTIDRTSGQTQAGIKLDDGYLDATVQATGTSTAPVTVDIGGSTVTGRITTTDASVTVDSSTVGGDVSATGDIGDTSITNTTAPSIYADSANSGNITLTGNAVTSASCCTTPLSAITQTGVAVVTGNTVIGSGHTDHAGLPQPAIHVFAHGIRLGSGGTVDGNRGMGSDSDSVLLSGSLASSATWMSPRHNLTVDTLGYLVGQLTVGSGTTLTVPAGVVVAEGDTGSGGPDTARDALVFDGSTLDASAGGATFENVRMNFQGDSANHPASALVVDATDIGSQLYYSAPGFPPYPQPSSATQSMTTPGLVIHGMRARATTPTAITSGSPGIASVGAPVDITGLVMRGTTDPWSSGAAIDLRSAAGSTIDHSVVYGGLTDGIDSTDGDVTVTHSRVFDNTKIGLSGNGLDVSCSIVEGNAGGIYAYDAGTAHINSSDLDGNVRPAQPPFQGTTAADVADVDQSSAAVDATGNWWGQPGGPATGQTFRAVTVQPVLDAPSPCATDAPLPPAPEPVGDLTGAAAGTTATLSWAAPDDQDVSGIRVEMAAGDAPPAQPDDGTLVYSGTGTSTTVPSLQPGSDYSFAVFTTSPYTAATGRTAVTVSVPAASAPSPTSHSVGVGVAVGISPAVVTAGAATTLSGVVTDTTTGLPIAGVPVHMLDRVHGTSTWHQLASLPTDSNGHYAYRVAPAHTIDVRVVTDGDATKQPGASVVVTAAVRPQVSFAVSAATVRAGTVVTMSGRVRPVPSGRSAILQRYYSGAWHNVRMLTVASDGTYAVRLTFATPGRFEYRVLVPATSSNATASSRDLWVSVAK